MKKLPLEPYSDEELEINDEMKSKIEKLMKFFDESGIDYDKFDSNKIPKLDLKAYPNVEVYQNIPGQHSTKKWLQAIRDIYTKEKNGENRISAIRKITSGWNVTETFDFLNWVKFYESGDHMKYKFAQLWYENPDIGPGYFLQVKKDPEVTPEPEVTKDVDSAREEANNSAERKKLIERQRNKIIGRLDSAEKLLRHPDGQIFSGQEFEALLETIYQLKKKIQMVNKISSSTKLYEDMIVRESNILRKNGMNKAANVLYTLAQTAGQSGEQAQGDPKGNTLPPAASPPDPSGAGNPGVPSGGAGTPAQPDGNATMPQSEPNNPPKGISDFIAGLESANFSPSENDAEDHLEVVDGEEDLVVEAQENPMKPNMEDENITTTPAPAPLDPSPVRAPEKPKKEKGPAVEIDTDEPLEVTEEIPPAPEAVNETTSGIGEKIDSLFSHVTIPDIVAELEDLAKIFKVREIPRKLSKVDMMLDGKGLASYFPSLSEAQNKDDRKKELKIENIS